MNIHEQAGIKLGQQGGGSGSPGSDPTGGGQRPHTFAMALSATISPFPLRLRALQDGITKWAVTFGSLANLEGKIPQAGTPADEAALMRADLHRVRVAALGHFGGHVVVGMDLLNGVDALELIPPSNVTSSVLQPVRLSL